MSQKASTAQESLTGADILLIPLNSVIVVEVLEVVEFFITHLDCGVNECVLCFSAAMSSFRDIHWIHKLVLMTTIARQYFDIHTRTAVTMMLLLAVAMIRLELQRISLQTQ